jgi:hypothetical protein
MPLNLLHNLWRGPLGQHDAVQPCQERLRELEASDAEMVRLRSRFRYASREASVRYEIGMWCLRNGQEQAGVRWLCTTLLVDPHYAPAHVALADYFEQAGQPKRAAQHRMSFE